MKITLIYNFRISMILILTIVEAEVAEIEVLKLYESNEL